MALIKEIQNIHSEMIQWRHHIHENPETAYTEVQTAEFVKAKLKSFGIPFVDGLGKTGIVGMIEGKEKGAKAIGLRADIDALPIVEGNTFAYVSKHKGKMHACGHDGHTTMLLGAAHYLAATRNFKGIVYLIFQPAEEGGAGAKAMIEDGLFKRFPMNEVYGMHNWPGLRAGAIHVKAGPMMAASSKFQLKITGKGCHAAMPHKGVDPLVATSHIVLALQTIVSRNVNPLDSAVVSITQITGGDTFNVIPEVVEIKGNIRSFKDSVRQFLFERVEEVIKGVTQAMGVAYELEISNGYPVTENSEREAKAALMAATKVLGADNVSEEFESSMGSEDFSFMLKEKPGCYAFIGNDRASPEVAPSLHNPFYDFNDEILPIGASYFATLAMQQLPL